MAKRRSLDLSKLSLRALLDIQSQGLCVAKALTDIGHQDKITIHSFKQAEAIQQYGTRPSLNKYKVSAADLRTCDGIKFASKTEMVCYRELRDSGLVFQLQPKFLLEPGFVDNTGKKQRPVFYNADFLIGPPRVDGDTPLQPGQYVIDVKGMRLPLYILKRKLFAARYHQHIVEIKTLQDMRSFIHKLKNDQFQEPAAPAVGGQDAGTLPCG